MNMHICPKYRRKFVDEGLSKGPSGCRCVLSAFGRSLSWWPAGLPVFSVWHQSIQGECCCFACSAAAEAGTAADPAN